MQPFYLVQSTYKGQPFVYETDLDGTTREKLVEMLAQGQFDTGTLDRVLLIDIGSGTAQDVSADIAKALSELSMRDGELMTRNVASFVDDFGYDVFKLVPDHLRCAA